MDSLNNLIIAIDDAFGKDRTEGAVFFHRDVVTGDYTVSPLFKVNHGTLDAINRLRGWSDALKYMAGDMVKKTLPAN